MQMGRESFDDLLRPPCRSIYKAHSINMAGRLLYGHIHLVMHMLRNVMTQRRMDVKFDFLANQTKFCVVRTGT